MGERGVKMAGVDVAQFDGQAPFEHWISRIAVRTALYHLRKAKRRKHEVCFDELGEDALEWLRGDDEKDELDSRGAAEILELAMRELSPAKQRTALRLAVPDETLRETVAAAEAPAAPPQYQKPLEAAEPSAHCLKLPKPSERVVRPGDSVKLLDGTDIVFVNTDPKNDWQVTVKRKDGTLFLLPLSDFYAKVDPA